MEKITTNDVIAFIKKAMQNNLKIRNCLFFNGALDIIDNNSENKIYIELESDSLRITTKSGEFCINDLTEKDILQFKLICEEVKSYQENCGIKDFNQFFKEDESRLSDINDLDDNDD